MILTINGGSSSIKFALFKTAESFCRVAAGQIERIGLLDSIFTVQEGDEKKISKRIEAPDHTVAMDVIMDWLEGQIGHRNLIAIGHRVVHGGAKYSNPQRITRELITYLNQLSTYDPEHLPEEIELMEAIYRRLPDLPQIACFDTAFHHDLPRTARLLPIPRRYELKGVRRYGFHGLSYSYLMEQLEHIHGLTSIPGKVILAHLGNGASLSAVLDGKPIDTSMGFTPAAGLPMSTRTGDLDPGLVWYLARTEQMSPKQFNDMINHQAGLLGVSEVSSDMRDLMELEDSDERAADAVDLFCYQAKKWIGAFAAALGGLDTLVFTGGIGENAAEIRARICEGLDFLGLQIDASRNSSGAPVISSDASRVTVRVIRTDEELMIAKGVHRVLQGG